jgi:hypothetical protein
MRWAVAACSVLLLATGVQEAAAFLPAATSQARLVYDKGLRAVSTREDDPFMSVFDSSSASEQEYFEIFLWLCAILEQRSTGLPMPIYVSPKHAPHGPQIKVSPRYGKVVV